MNANLRIQKGLILSTILLQLSITANAPSSFTNFMSSSDSTTSIESRSVSFKSGEYNLKGTLIASRMNNKKVPAIIFVVGSGGESSSYTTPYYTKMLDSLFESNLPKDSVAFFYFDKRGVGGSEGKWFKTNFEERADDVKAAADYLKTVSFIDSSKIAVVGHSQGGWITQICLSKYPESFVGGISMAGPTFGVKQQVINDYTSNMMCNEGLTEKEARDKATKKVNFDFFLTSIFPIKEDWKQLNAIKKFEPSEYIRSINKPLLLMFCENDALVSPTKSKDELDKLFPDGYPQNIQTVTIKGANHGFKLSDLCYQGPYSKIPFAEDSKQHIYSWAKRSLLN